MELIMYSYLNMITFFNIVLHKKIDKLLIDMETNQYKKVSLMYRVTTKEEQTIQVLINSMSYM